MDSGGFLWDEFSELLLRKGTESFLCYDLQELDGEIKGALIESDGIFKSEKSLGVLRALIYKCAGYASDAHFLLQQNCILPAGKEQQFTCSAGRELLKIKGEQQAETYKASPAPPAPRQKAWEGSTLNSAPQFLGRRRFRCKLLNVSFKLHK